jgi:hypothetical protein
VSLNIGSRGCLKRTRWSFCVAMLARDVAEANKGKKEAEQHQAQRD